MPLNNAQKFENFGRMIHHGLTNLAVPKQDRWLQKLMRYGKDYVQNGTGAGNPYSQAERAEAMVAAKEFIFEAVTGLDAETDAHHMDNHWLKEAEEDD